VPQRRIQNVQKGGIGPHTTPLSAGASEHFPTHPTEALTTSWSHKNFQIKIPTKSNLFVSVACIPRLHSAED